MVLVLSHYGEKVGGGRVKGGATFVRSGPGQVQVRSRSGLVRVWFRLQLKFNSLELDSEVG